MGKEHALVVMNHSYEGILFNLFVSSALIKKKKLNLPTLVDWLMGWLAAEQCRLISVSLL